MPELPEVETSRRGIEPYLQNQYINNIVIRQAKLRWPVSQQLYQLHNEKILSVQRRAKYILLELTSGWIMIHLGMSGSLRILTTPLPANKHDHIDLILNSGHCLRYTDPRRFGSWLWVEDPFSSAQLNHLGPEPLSEFFNSVYLFEKSRNKQVKIKSWLMDNSVVVGVGNIYASESLFISGILPQRPAGSLTLSEIEKLVIAIKTVLKKSIEQGGTTLKDFLQSDGKPGYFAQELLVYGKTGKPCQLCGTKICCEKIGQRSSYFCTQCQK